MEGGTSSAKGSGAQGPDRGDPEGDPVVGFEGVSVLAPDGSTILRHVDLAARAGRLTVLAGPSGAGKSTTLRLANRLEVPAAGVVRYRGVDTGEVDPLELRRRVGMVFQRPVVFAGTVRDNLQVAAAGADDEVMAEALGRAGLSGELLDRTADDLSGGEAQRMCIARTLLTGPEVLLMDEPTSSLDPANRRAIEDLARGLADDGLAVLWVTHDLAQARRLGDEIVVLVDGRNATADEAARYLDGPDEADDDEPEEGAR
jgi:putative ABC transport system ATP-binding protein